MRLLALVAACVLMPGCVTTESMPTFVMRFTLTNDGNETLPFDGYPHCGTARVGDGVVTVDSPLPHGKALVVVDPTLVGEGAGHAGFAALGTEGMAFGLDPEARIHDGVSGSDADIAVLRYEDGHLFVDGQRRDLPFNGTAVRPGLWSAAFTIEEGPHKVRVDHSAKSCA
jgi:hypothetical protein